MADSIPMESTQGSACLWTTNNHGSLVPRHALQHRPTNTNDTGEAASFAHATRSAKRRRSTGDTTWRCVAHPHVSSAGTTALGLNVDHQTHMTKQGQIAIHLDDYHYAVTRLHTNTTTRAIQPIKVLHRQLAPRHDDDLPLKGPRVYKL